MTIRLWLQFVVLSLWVVAALTAVAFVIRNWWEGGLTDVDLDAPERYFREPSPENRAAAQALEDEIEQVS